MELERPVVFFLLGLPITTTVVTTWATVAALTLGAMLMGRRLERTPARWQAMLEWGLWALRGMMEELGGADSALYVPLVATIATFILVANLLGILPGVQAPTGDINTTAALAAIVFASVHYAGVRELGWWGYLKRFAQP